jgi:cysteine-S-conjugate beta-lyase
LAARYGVTVLADEIFAPLVLPGRTHHPFVSVSPQAARHGIVLPRRVRRGTSPG